MNRAKTRHSSASWNPSSLRLRLEKQGDSSSTEGGFILSEAEGLE
jgi:hypothetical protein